MEGLLSTGLPHLVLSCDSKNNLVRICQPWFKQRLILICVCFYSQEIFSRPGKSQEQLFQHRHNSLIRSQMPRYFIFNLVLWGITFNSKKLFVTFYSNSIHMAAITVGCHTNVSYGSHDCWLSYK